MTREARPRWSQVNGDLSSDSDDDDEATERCLLGGALVQVPQVLCEEETLLQAVLSIDTWNNVLTEAHKLRLMNFLPLFPENDKEEKVETLQRLFSGCNFKFGNPIRAFFGRLREGLLVPDIARTASLVRRASYRDYRLHQRRYHCRLLQEVLVSRKRLLDASLEWGPPGCPRGPRGAVPRPPRSRKAPGLRVPLAQRARWRYCTELQELRDRLGDTTTEDEDDLPGDVCCAEGGAPPKLLREFRRQLHRLEVSLGPDMRRVASTLAAGPLGPHRCDTNSGRFLSKCLTLSEITDERFRNMLLLHRHKRLAGLDHAELDTSSVTLDDLIVRTNLSRKPRPLAATGVSRCQMLQPWQFVVEAPVKNERMQALLLAARTTESGTANTAPVIVPSPPTPEVQPPPPPPPPPPSPPEEEEEEEEEPPPPEAPPSPVARSPLQSDIPVPPWPTWPPSPVPPSSPPCRPSCFFALLRDLFSETPEHKMSAAKLEERVRAWSHSPGAQQVEWCSRRKDIWADRVSSALRFLAGDYIGVLPENFVPYLDYKEKQQQWQWIGAGRDSDLQSQALCDHWLQGREQVATDALDASQGSPPPPKCTTDWTVRPTTDEERGDYRNQECVRYQNPHRAFTFRVHGYEAVVGPVKGVYGKESGVNKAREHSLLVSDRPPFVTILSLVRDAAARLPNGEGTRADICELLKDSQYLAPASDQQIHTVVSGALDRLHYEKDPCVKYDVNRKLWIYLHRSRTEDEFEKIHQAQAAAARAKKAIQKSKAPRLGEPRTPKARPEEGPRSPAKRGREEEPEPAKAKGFQAIVIKQEPKSKPLMARLVPGSQVGHSSSTHPGGPLAYKQMAGAGRWGRFNTPPPPPRYAFLVKSTLFGIYVRDSNEPKCFPPSPAAPNTPVQSGEAPRPRFTYQSRWPHHRPNLQKNQPYDSRSRGARDATIAPCVSHQRSRVKLSRIAPVYAEKSQRFRVVCNLVGGPRPALRLQQQPPPPQQPAFAPRLLAVPKTPPVTAAPCTLASPVLLGSPPQPTVVLANQVKGSPAYVMAPPVVVGGQPLKGIKVIPMPPRGARPLLARLIGPPLRPPLAPRGAPLLLQVQTGESPPTEGTQ
ncbi:unnamed protein product [Ixodes hexagonus]